MYIRMDPVDPSLDIQMVLASVSLSGIEYYLDVAVGLGRP